MSYRNKRKNRAYLIAMMLMISLSGCGKTVVKNPDSTTATETEMDTTASITDGKEKVDTDKPIAVELQETYTISETGVYEFSGSLAEGQIIVDAEDEDVEIILNGVDITCENSACIYVKAADEVTLTLEKGSCNTLTSSGVFQDDGDIKVDGTIFSKADLLLNGEGTVEIVSKEKHGIVCKDELTVASGNYNIAAASHGMEANDGIVIDGGNIRITNSYEGMECQSVIINGGDIDICAEDDGINAADGENNTIEINGGNIKVNAKGDGLDSNGTIAINGGYTLVSGSVNNGNSAVDFEYGCTITGGVLVATGSSGMVERMSGDSTQVSVTVGLSAYTSESFTITDSAGVEICSVTPEKEYNCITVSSPELSVGESYTITVGDEVQEIQVTEIVYSNVSGGFGPGGMQGPGGMGRPDDMEVPEGMERPDGMQPPDGMPGQEKFPRPEGKESF